MRSTCRATTGIQDDVTSCTARVDRSKAIHTAGTCETVNFERRGGGREASERRFPGRVTSTYAFPYVVAPRLGMQNLTARGQAGAGEAERVLLLPQRGAQGRGRIAASGARAEISGAASPNTEEW